MILASAVCYFFPFLSLWWKFHMHCSMIWSDVRSLVRYSAWVLLIWCNFWGSTSYHHALRLQVDEQMMIIAMFLSPLFGKASLGSELVHVAPKTAIGPCQHRIIFVLSNWSTSAKQLPIQAAVPLALLFFPSWACDENYMCIAQWYDLMFARLWGTGHECYVTDIKQFLRVNQLTPWLFLAIS